MFPCQPRNLAISTSVVLRAGLVALLDGLMSREKCLQLQDAIWSARALRARLARKIEIYNLDEPLRFEWCGPNLGNMRPGGAHMTAAEAYVDELAARVAAIVVGPCAVTPSYSPGY